MIGEIKAAKVYGGLEVETVLEPAEQPFLFDHAPDENTPWLPGVMATEALAEMATLFAPGYSVAAVENEQMTGAFKFFHSEPRTLYLSATGKTDRLMAISSSAQHLSSVTKPAREGLPTRVQEHFIADVRLTKNEPENIRKAFEAPDDASLATHDEQIYEIFFHGPAYQVLERVKVDGNTAIGLVAKDLPPNTSPADARSLDSAATGRSLFPNGRPMEYRSEERDGLSLGF